MKSCSLMLLLLVPARGFWGVDMMGVRRGGFVGEENGMLVSGEFASGSGEERSGEEGS